MYWKNVSRNLKRSTPGRSWARRGKKAGPAERIIDVDLVSSTTRYSRLTGMRERAAQVFSPYWALLLVAGVVAAFFIASR